MGSRDNVGFYRVMMYYVGFNRVLRDYVGF